MDIGGFKDAYAWCAGREKVGSGNEEGDYEGNGGEEAEGVLEADDGGIHGGRGELRGRAPFGMLGLCRQAGT